MIPFNIVCSRRGFQLRRSRDHIRVIETRPGVENHNFFLGGKPSAGDQLIVSRSGTRPVAGEENSLVTRPIAQRRQDFSILQVQGKPPAAAQKIVDGKLEKYFSTVCLIDQTFVKVPEKTVKELLTETIAKTGENIQIRRFVRYQLGS